MKQQFFIVKGAIFLVLILGVAACSQKTTATATTPAVTPASQPPANPGSKNGQPAVSMKDMRVEADPEVTGGRSAKTRKLAEREKAGPVEVFSLRKTPCYGDCPVFKLRVMSDGSVYYKGIDNVKMLGEYRAQTSADRVDRLLRNTIAAGVYSWSDTYPEETALFIADASNTITTVDWYGRKKTITNNSDAPEELLAFEAELLSMIEELAWESEQ